MSQTQVIVLTATPIMIALAILSILEPLKKINLSYPLDVLRANLVRQKGRLLAQKLLAKYSMTVKEKQVSRGEARMATANVKALESAIAILQKENP